MQARRPVPIYNIRQRLQSKLVTWRNINGVASSAANTAAVSTNTILYLITIQRRCRFCLTENSGAWIWLEGRNQKSNIECSLSAYGIKIGGANMKSRTCPIKKSELHSESSMIFTTNSRAGCDMMCAPRFLPYHLPVHQALFV